MMFFGGYSVNFYIWIWISWLVLFMIVYLVKGWKCGGFIILDIIDIDKSKGELRVNIGNDF